MVRTPNLDRLASEGVNFTNCFTPIPMCVPARCSITTGLWPLQHGVLFNYNAEFFKPLDRNFTSIETRLQSAGYRTIHIGRWHVDPRRTPHDFGFHDNCPDWRYGKWRMRREIPPVPRDQGWRGCLDPYVKPEETPLARLTDRTIDAIGSCLGECDPFFISYNTMEPHLPCILPEPWCSMYDPATIDSRPSFGDPLHGKPEV